MYKLNNIALSTYGIIPGRIEGEGIAVKGIFDLPKRIGITGKDWDDEDGIEPYVAADEIFLAGRDILFAGLLIGSKLEIENNINLLKAFIKTFNKVVPFETPYGTVCVYVTKITPKIYSGGATLLIEFREPQVGATCSIVVETITYYSAVYSEIAYKNNCNSGYHGSEVTLTATAGQFTSTLSQEAANQLAINWVRENKQTYANVLGTCTVNPTMYFNEKLTGEKQKDNCGSGYAGSIVTYTVAANKYSSLISQADANAKAQAEIDVVLTQAYANANGTCTLLAVPSFRLTQNRVYQAGFGQNIRSQWFAVGTEILIGATYNIMIFGVTISYTTIGGDTPLSIVTSLKNLFNAKTINDWMAFNQGPGYNPISALSWPPTSSIIGSNVFGISTWGYSEAIGWIS